MDPIAFEKVTLSNGLDVILHEDHSIPLVAVNVWYHVGSKDEEVGHTGFAHLFEHMMFEGSKHHNSSHFEPLQQAGANLNGSTTPDRTNYWEDVPSNYLELALWLESDRMGFLLDALDQQRFDIQRDVVKNERRQSYENRPYGMASWHIQGALYPSPHPYHWMTIGSEEDLDAAELEDVHSFFRRFYSPSNASLAVAGDFQRDQALDLVNRYFGDLPPGPPLPRIGRRDSSLAGRVELEMRDKVSLPRLYIAWPTPPDMDPVDAPLELLQGVLADGLSSRLHKRLVYELQIAQSASVRYHPGEIAGQFLVQVTAAEGHDLAEVEEATDAELARLHTEPPTDEEITRVKNRIESSHYRQLTRIGGFGGRADQLNHFNVIAGDLNLINSSLDRYLAVGRDDILQASESVLDHRQVRLRVLPEVPLKPATTGVDRSVMPPPAPEPEFIPPTPLKKRLSNGLGIVVVEKPGVPVVSFSLLLHAGAVTDPMELPGLASFTGQMLTEGTESRSSQEIASAFEFIGARISADVRREYTILSTETMSRHWPTALELVADLVKHPTFPAHELERVRREHLTDLRRSKDDGGAIADRLMSGLIFSKDSGYGHHAMGTEDALAAVTREDVEKHFRRCYGPALATLIVVGDVTLDQVVDLAEEHLGDWAGSAEAAAVNPPSLDGGTGATTIYLVDRPGSAQSVIRAVQPTVPRLHPDYFGLTLVNYAFGGQFSARLNQNLRQDKGYSYGYQSSIIWYRGASLLMAGGSVQTEVTKESVQETLREFQEITDSRPLTPEELETSKAGILRAYPASFERAGLILNHLVQMVQFDLPDDYFQTVRPGISAVSLDEARHIAGERIRSEGLQILVVGDAQTVEPGLKELGLPLVRLDADGARLE
ncbi:MAG: insulinase family protein [Chloroflexi bacterium]|nr:insulinase family protein [Chloroflexota bacterium]